MTVVQRARVPGLDRLVWLVVGEDHLPVEPIGRHLAHLDDVECSPNTLRAYAHHLELFWNYQACAQRGAPRQGPGPSAAPPRSPRVATPLQRSKVYVNFRRLPRPPCATFQARGLA